MIPKDEAKKLEYYREFAQSGMGPITPAFQWGAVHGPTRKARDTTEPTTYYDESPDKGAGGPE